MARKDLEEARVRLYEKKDRTRVVIGVGLAAFALFMFMAVLNVLGAVGISLRTGDAPAKRFLTWVVVAIMGFTGPHGVYLARQQKTTQQDERRPPAFLR